MVRPLQHTHLYQEKLFCDTMCDTKIDILTVYTSGTKQPSTHPRRQAPNSLAAAEPWKERSMDDDTSFGFRLKQRRRTLDLTQNDLARLVGCAPVTIRKIEAGELRPSRQVAERLARCLDLTPAERETFVAHARGRAGYSLG